MNAPAPAPQAGRTCPLDYRYGPAVFDRDPEIVAPALYVAGGLYGNLSALKAAESMSLAEPGSALVLNGDFHWFDAEAGWFAAVEAIASRHPALRGNVETEIARGVTDETGCGCAYPEHVDPETVARSNRIVADLGRVASQVPGARDRLAALPMHLVAQVGAARVAIVHGDAESLAGWRFDRAVLDDPAEAAWHRSVRDASRVDVFASTHTCTAAMRRIGSAGAPMIVANNGAAGMPNAAGHRHGIVTRIGTSPPPVRPLYGTTIAGVHVDALPLAYEHETFLAAFDRVWPVGSAAELSYRRRIVAGPVGSLKDAAPDPESAQV